MLANLSIKEFLAETAGNTPVPGGGSISALNGAMAAALTEMVAGLTIGKKNYEECEGQMKAIVVEAALIRERFTSFIDEDSEAYRQVVTAFKLPKETAEEKAKRSEAIQEATKQAARVPMKVAEELHAVMEAVIYVAQNGNRNAVTDACVAMMAARTCVLGALLNVRINLSSVKDEVFVERMKAKADRLETETVEMEKELLDWIKTILS